MLWKSFIFYLSDIEKIKILTYIKQLHEIEQVYTKSACESVIELLFSPVILIAIAVKP